MDRRITGGMTAAIVATALAVQSVLALGTGPADGATPAPGESGQQASIDPGFVVRVGANLDPGFIVAFEDRSHDTGFIVIPGGPAGGAPAPATPEAPVITLGTP